MGATVSRRPPTLLGVPKAAGEERTYSLAGVDVRVTSADKVFFSERGETKGDLVDHYIRVGEPLLRAMGGRRPLTFLVDGAPLAADAAQRQATWLPEGPGFYAVTVLDADGAVARAPVRVR